MCAMINGYGFDMGLGYGQIQMGGVPAQPFPATGDQGFGDLFSSSPELGEAGPMSSNTSDMLGAIGSWATEGQQQGAGGDQIGQVLQSVMEKLAQGDIQGAIAELMKLLGGGQGQGQQPGGGDSGQAPGGAAPVQGSGGGGDGGSRPGNSNAGSDSGSSSSSSSNSTVNNNITINNISVCQDTCEDEKPPCDQDDTGLQPDSTTDQPAGNAGDEPVGDTRTEPAVDAGNQPAGNDSGGGEEPMVAPPMERGKPS